MGEYPLDSFIFYRSFRDSINEMTAKDQLVTLLAICDYALYGIEPELTRKMPKSVFTLAKPNIDANFQKRISGKKGGRPKNHRFSNSETNGFPPEEPNEDVTSNATSNGDGDTAASPPTPTPKRRFVPPTLEEVTAYVKERGSKVDPQGFIDYYASKGWMVGKSPMKDWKAACRGAESWERWDRKPSKALHTAKDYDEGGPDFLGR